MMYSATARYLCILSLAANWACDTKINLATMRNDIHSAEQASKDNEIQTSNTTSQIDEPINVSGAFLNCSRSAWNQGDPKPIWNCQLAGLDQSTLDYLTKNEITAAFAKVQENNDRSLMTILDNDPNTLSWTLEESMVSITSSMIEGSFTAGDLQFTVYSTNSDAITLNLNLNFWVAGEPNNSNSLEYCTEFYNSATQNIADPMMQSTAYGKLNDTPCDIEPMFFICRHLSNPLSPLILSETKGLAADHKEACPDGYGFSFPATIAEATEIGILVDQRTGSDADIYAAVWSSLMFTEDRELTIFQ